MRIRGVPYRVGLLLGLTALAFAACSEDDKTNELNNASSGGSANGSQNGASGSNGSTASPNNPDSRGSTGNGVTIVNNNSDTTVPINPIASGAVPCGGDGALCVAPNLTCCTVDGGAGAPDTFSCASAASACPEGSTTVAECSSQASCASGQVCCRVQNAPAMGGMGGGTTATCESACDMGAAQLCFADAECGGENVCNNGVCATPQCTADSCGGAELCCRGMGGGAGAAPACAAPGADGLCPMGRRQVCATDADCPEGDTCAPFGGGGGGGGGGGNNLVCTPPPCTPTSCAVGQACCVGGGLGGNPTCTASTDGACAGNPRVVCITDAECAPEPGTACLPAPNGGGGVLSCRPPPGPAPDAGAGADAG